MTWMHFILLFLAMSAVLHFVLPALGTYGAIFSF